MLRTGLVAALLLAAAGNAIAVEVTARSGAETRIGKFGAVNTKTCDASTKQPSIAQAPRHGTLEFRLDTTRTFSNRSRCHGQQVRAFGFYYRPQPGFRGRDQVVVSTFLNNGRIDVRTDYTYDITVR